MSENFDSKKVEQDEVFTLKINYISHENHPNIIIPNIMFGVHRSSE